MKQLLSLAVCASALLLNPAFAQPTASQNTQQSKMSACNKDAAGIKGDERKAFMKNCLSAKPPAAGNSQQVKMKSCNAAAAGKKGDERKKFMSECLKK
jgi:hypothetical protein